MFQDSLSKIDRQECIIRAEACGISPTNFLATLTDEKTANHLNTTIESALRAGVFGVPTFVLSGESFWGNDRIVLLRHYLRLHDKDYRD